jgi:septum formation inhibitor-activating ATPase MinD
MSEPTVTELFLRDPLKLSEQDIDQIINNLRDSRARFIQGDAKAGTPEVKKSAAKKKSEALVAQVGEVDLSDLGL